jgi:urease accessory protein
VTGFASGALQALMPVHLLALIAVALPAARVPFHRRVGVVAAFAAGLVAGLVTLALGVGETPAADGLMAAAALCGLAAAAALPLPVILTALLAAVIGFAVALDSPPDSILLREAIFALVGTACTGVAAMAIAVEAAALLGRLWQGIVLRVAGSWTAAIAILVLALRWAA